MKTTKHTPGPWKYNPTVRRSKSDFEREYGLKGPFYTSIQTGEVCTIKGQGIARVYEPNNAALIAAAPELLEIAKAYRNLLKTMAHTDGEVATYGHILDVIAKAEGKV